MLAVVATACGKSVPPAVLHTSAVASFSIKPSNIKRISRRMYDSDRQRGNPLEGCIP